LEREIETVLFRALQEALTNVYRHSGGSTVDVLLQLDAEQVRMEIKDDGKGMPEQRVQRVTKGGVGSGVGLAGMRERVREVGGSLALLSGSTGNPRPYYYPAGSAERRVFGITKRREFFARCFSMA